MGFTVKFECAEGHSQLLHYDEGFSEDMVHDHAVLVAGGTLRSLGVVMPGYRCAWPDGPRPCGAKLSFRIEESGESAKAKLASGG
jgi:hypothetical protein